MINEYGNYIDESKIALMGHSAGGHLALLYAYAGYKVNGEWTNGYPIKVVISEAGPTCFGNNNDGDIYIRAMKGEADYSTISPAHYASINIPTTILAYGYSFKNQSDLPDGNDEDDVYLPFNQAFEIVNKVVDSCYENGYIPMINHQFHDDMNYYTYNCSVDNNELINLFGFKTIHHNGLALYKNNDEQDVMVQAFFDKITELV